MKAFVVMEWNCMEYEDSDRSPVAVFGSLAEVEAFIAAQPERPERSVDVEEARKDRFSVDEFDGAKAIQTFGVRMNGKLTKGSA